ASTLPLRNPGIKWDPFVPQVPHSSAEDVAEAVASARRGLREWSSLQPRERGRVMTRAANLLRSKLEEFAQLETRDTGKPIWESRCDMVTCIDALEYFGGLACVALNGRHIPLTPSAFSLVTREPLGVIGAIGAWNYPLQGCLWKAAPALACGNAVVFKPSPLTPATAVAVGEVFADAGLPPGVYNVVQGGSQTGQALCDHPKVDKLSFTGSVATGQRVMKAGAEKVIPVTLELGGKSPLIVFEDADLVNAVRGAVMANFLSQGEVCSNGTRVFVHRSLEQSFRETLLSVVQRMKVGDPCEDDTVVGATITEEHAQKVLGFIDRAQAEGAEVLIGGKRLSGGELPERCRGGVFLSPCVLGRCSDDMEVVREEVFGSVLSLLTFDSEEEVVERANDTPYGLAAGLFTRDVRRAHAVAQRLQAGNIWVNNYNLSPVEAPFGGFKRSGVGRENGEEALRMYSQTKSIYVELGDVDVGPMPDVRR
ncbi:unnamed protein product, partial [Cyprideis torosa]